MTLGFEMVIGRHGIAGKLLAKIAVKGQSWALEFGTWWKDGEGGEMSGQYKYRGDRIITRAGGEIYSPAPISCITGVTAQLR